MGCSFSDTKEHADAVHGGIGHGDELSEAVDFVVANQSGAEDLSQRLELSFACENLPNMDTTSLTDCACVLYIQQKGGTWLKVGQTECITDNLNPKFIKSISVRYMFEERQKMKVNVYDVDDFSKGVAYETQNIIGSVEIWIHEIVRAPKQTLKREIQNQESKRKSNGQLVISGEEEKRGSNNQIKLHFTGRDFNQSVLMYRLYRNKQIDTEEFVPIYESETCRKVNGGYQFKMAELGAYTLIRDNFDRLVLIQVFEWKPNGRHISLGICKFLCQEILGVSPDPLLIKTKKNKTVGRLEIAKAEYLERFSFLDFVFGGLEITMTVAIDFTLSNGNPHERDSLHYFDFNNNQYLKAITSVGSILENYDTNKRIPVLGFGAKIPGVLDTRASHCFAVNGNILNPEVVGINGVIQTYKKALGQVKLNGPTYFAEIVKYINDMAEFELSQMKHKYFILLIITDGIINDYQKTVDQIVRGTSLPLSIIIVGVGSEDFTEMNDLDADETPLYSHTLNKYMERDIVQFIPFEEYKNDPMELARQTLEEVPRQLTSFFASKGIKPQQVEAAGAMAVGGYQGNDGFYMGRRDIFANNMRNMGFTDMQLQMLMNRGLPELSEDLFVMHSNNPNYYNPLSV